MKIICDRCGYIIDRDRYREGKLIEEYKNIFGTTCTNCKYLIKPFKKPFFDKKREIKMEILKEEMRKRLKKIMTGEM